MSTTTNTTQSLTGTYVADPVHSTFQFAIRHMGVSMFRATFGDATARVVADEGRIEFDGSVKAESISITEPPEFREHVVYGADFFDARNHPEISFCSTDVQLGDDGSVSGEGELTIRGITKPVTASGTYQPPIEDPFGAERAALEVSATVDRRAWGFDYQAALPKGGDALGYEVQLTVHVELLKEG